MKEDNRKKYNKLVNKWSRIYKKRIGDVFSIEELKQEAWLAILEVEESIRKFDEEIAEIRELEIGNMYTPYVLDSFVENKIAYIAQGIKNKILWLLIEELKHRKTESLDVETVFSSDIDTLAGSKQLVERLKTKLDTIPHANFVLTHMNSYSVRDISELAQREGKTISKSAVHKLILLIREEFEKIIKEE
jgi:DNA-directed RNA polymerase specialized sigma24 family protein